MRKAVIGFSGGMDSTTLLAWLLAKGYHVIACTFTYGSKHNQYENKAAKDIIDFYNNENKRGLGDFKIDHRTFDLTATFSGFKSNLLKSGGEIPEGHYEEESMSLTVVPGRNTIFSSIMLGVAESEGAELITLGVHAGDHVIYPDCREAYVRALKQLIHEASEGKINVIAPFIKINKAEILETGYLLGIPVPYGLTRTCYKDQAFSCGKCGSCQERLEAFAKIGEIDPIPYE